MSIAETQVRYTPDDLLAMPDSDSYELIDGQLVERHMGMTAGLVESQVIYLLKRYDEALTDERLKGWVLSSSVGYRCFADTTRIRKPDVSYIRRIRLPAISEGWIGVVPDAAIEVVSPGDVAADLDMKLED